jgi:hypothetical protein
MVLVNLFSKSEVIVMRKFLLALMGLVMLGLAGTVNAQAPPPGGGGGTPPPPPSPENVSVVIVRTGANKTRIEWDANTQTAAFLFSVYVTNTSDQNATLTMWAKANHSQERKGKTVIVNSGTEEKIESLLDGFATSTQQKFDQGFSFSAYIEANGCIYSIDGLTLGSTAPLVDAVWIAPLQVYTDNNGKKGVDVALRVTSSSEYNRPTGLKLYTFCKYYRNDQLVATFEETPVSVPQPGTEMIYWVRFPTSSTWDRATVGALLVVPYSTGDGVSIAVEEYKNIPVDFSLPPDNPPPSAPPDPAP